MEAPGGRDFCLCCSLLSTAWHERRGGGETQQTVVPNVLISSLRESRAWGCTHHPNAFLAPPPFLSGPPLHPCGRGGGGQSRREPGHAGFPTVCTHTTPPKPALKQVSPFNFTLPRLNPRRVSLRISTLFSAVHVSMSVVAGAALRSRRRPRVSEEGPAGQSSVR